MYAKQKTCRIAPMLVASLVLLGCIEPRSPTDARADNTVDDTPDELRVQVEAGKANFDNNCVVCHGEGGTGGQFAPALTGIPFLSKWGNRSAYELFRYISQTMPPGSPGTLTDEQTTQLLAYIFDDAGVLDGGQIIPSDRFEMSKILLPEPPDGLAAQEVIKGPPPPNPAPNPLKQLSAVSDSDLSSPPAEDWLTWRRTYDAHGYSPLKQITSENIKDLRLVWSWNMPPGRNIVSPLVRDGVMFVWGAGDRLYAFDAARGDLLWRYDRMWSGATTRYSLRSISLYDNSVIFPTDDGNVVALDAKTGEVQWDRNIVKPTEMRFSGGPMIADGKIIMGTSTGSTETGRNYVLALDAKNGEEVWRFYTVPLPDEPGGDTWNNIAADKRTGASIWMPGGYDPESGLVLFGTGQNYISELTRRLAAGAISNAQLYADTTLALDVKTGALVWHYQHLANDMWSYDWAFERTLTELPINGALQRVAVTSGKQGIFDVMSLEDGRYQYSIDLGLQNVVTDIDPETGAKTTSPDAVPESGTKKLVCPSEHGVRNWPPTAYIEETRVLYIPYFENCMQVRTPPQPGDFTFGGSGYKAYPRPDSDGLYGGVWALDLVTGDTLWRRRQRAVPTAGILATAGDVVLTGYLDREFSAHSASTGERLWHTRLSDVPGTAPISFMVEGKQYIAITTGNTGAWGRHDPFSAPEIKTPEQTSAAIWVFALPTD